MRIVFVDGSFNVSSIGAVSNYAFVSSIANVHLEAREVAEINRWPIAERGRWRCDLINQLTVMARRRYINRNAVTNGL